MTRGSSSMPLLAVGLVALIAFVLSGLGLVGWRFSPYRPVQQRLVRTTVEPRSGANSLFSPASSLPPQD